MDSSIAAVMSTSPTSGAFRIVLGPSPSIAATMCLVTAFFEPRTWMSPRSGPDGSTCQVSVTQTTVGARPLRSGAVHRTFRSSTGSTGSAGSAGSAGSDGGSAAGWAAGWAARAGRIQTNQYPAAASSTAPMVQPSATVPSPTYFSPEARITKVMTGRMKRSGARDDSSEPISTAGTLPTMMEAVTPNSTCPKASAPRAAAAVSGTACVRSVPTSWPALRVGPSQLARAEQRVREQQQDDHQGSRTHRGQADDQPAHHADQDGRHRPDGDLRDLAGAGLAGPAVQEETDHHGRRARQQRRPQGDLDVLGVGGTVAEQPQQVGAEERHRHRTERHPADQAQVAGALVQMHRRADRPHHRRGDQVAGDGSAWFHRA